MEYIAEKEEELGVGKQIRHSFSPEALPDNVSQIPRSAVEELRAINDAPTPTAKICAMSPARRYLPCHYFDHICGSSTGALVFQSLGGSLVSCLTQIQSDCNPSWEISNDRSRLQRGVQRSW